eukprot:TRINITY_DN3958_c0_g1_i1.p1 TRINITY_DN3958_c0_g1~~TRINITY_DN3958_c0_g1_i1.p1  ORF type:complete len:535 (-),score=102.43 TRINITY_DN3958_c0_g1_i1:317-1921(-)
MEMVKETVVSLAKEPRIRVVLAFTIASFPMLFGGLVWLSALAFHVQVLVGAITGLAIMLGYYYMTVHRSHVRMREAVRTQQLSSVDAHGLKRIVPEDSMPAWVQSGFDKVEWINKCLAEVWPFLDKAVSDMVVQQVQPILDQYKLGVISELKVKEVKLGTVSPTIGGFKLTEGAEDECMLECEFDWRTESGQKVAITVKTIGPDFDVEVKDFTVYGIARIILKPLMEELPGFGAILVSLREPPEVDFRTSILGGDLTALPGVDNAIDNVIRSALEDTLVWPCRIVVPIAPGDFSYLQLHPVGTLNVLVYESKGIKGKDWFGKSDPFLMLFIRPKEETIKRTSTKSNTNNPTWDEGFDLDVEDPEFQKLHIRLMDADSMSAADLVGSAEVPLQQLEPFKAHELWLPLVKDPKNPKEGEAVGQVHVTLTYRPLPGEVEKQKKKEAEGKAREGAEDQTLGGEFQTAEKATGKTPDGVGQEEKKEVELPSSPEEHDRKLDEQDIGAQHAAAVDLNDKLDAKASKDTDTADGLMEESGL